MTSEESKATTRDLKERAKPFLMPILILAAVLLSGLLILKPKLDDISSQRRRLEMEKKKLVQLTQKVAALEGLNEYELSVRTEWALEILPAEKDVARTLINLRRLSQDADVDLVDIEVEPGEISTDSAQAKAEKKTEKEIPSLDFEIIVWGSIGSIENFIERIASVAPIMRVELLDLTQEEESEAKITLKAFYFSLPQTLTTPGQSLPAISFEENKVYEALAQIEILKSEVPLIPIESGKEDPFTL